MTGERSGAADHDDLVKLVVRLRLGDDVPSSENLWARPVEAHEGAGTFALENNAMYVPLAAGDLVRAEISGSGRWQVVDVVEPAPVVLTVAELLVEQSEPETQAMVERWEASGARWTEGLHRLLFTVWEQPTDGTELGSGLRPDVEAGRLRVHEAVPPEGRVRDEQVDIDFELDRTEPAAVDTTYWVGDDPWWAEHDLSDPDLLAFVQRLAGEDERVARALEQGRHEEVLEFVRRLSHPDPTSLEPLDGPLFDE